MRLLALHVEAHEHPSSPPAPPLELEQLEPSDTIPAPPWWALDSETPAEE